MRIFAISKKVIKELLRDKRTLALMFLAPVLIMWLLNTMFSVSTSTNVTLATVDVPTQITKTMDKIDGVTLENVSNTKAKSELKDGSVDAIISYDDNGFNVTYANTDSAKTTMTRQVLKSAISAYKTQTLVETVSKLTATQTQSASSNSQNFDISESYQYGNEDTGFFVKLIPVLIGFITFFFVFLISGMALLKERTSGTLDRLLATPVKRSEIVFGYLISYGFLAIIQTAIIVLSSIWLLDLEVVGSLFNVIIVSSCLALVALAFGILLSTLAKSEFQMMQFIPIIVFPQMFFSGIIPLDSMADWVQTLGKVLPLSYSGDALSKIILQGGGFSDIAGDVGILLIFLVVLTIINIIGLKRYRKV